MPGLKISRINHLRKETHLLGRAQTKHAWYSTDDNTINRHIGIPTVYLQLETVSKVATNNDTNIHNTNNKNVNLTISPTLHANEVHSSMTKHPSTTNDAVLTSKEPVRRSQRIHSLTQQREP